MSILRRGVWPRNEPASFGRKCETTAPAELRANYTHSEWFNPAIGLESPGRKRTDSFPGNWRSRFPPAIRRLPSPEAALLGPRSQRQNRSNVALRFASMRSA